MGIDLGKSMYHLFGVNEYGRPVLRMKLRRKELLGYLAKGRERS